MKRKAGWFGLAMGLGSLFAGQASAKDLLLTFWNSSDCGRPSADTVSTILQIPRDNNDPKAGVTCAHIQGTNFNGWAKDTHNQQVIGYLNTHAIEEGCQVVLYNKGPSGNQYPEEIAVGPCWQAYRRIGKGSTCPSVSFDGDNIALSYCCGDGCHVALGMPNAKDPIFPAAPPLTLTWPNFGGGDTRAGRSVPAVGPGSPARAAARKQNARSDKSTKNRRADLATCKFSNSTRVRYTYLPSVQTEMELSPCQSGVDFGGGPCSFEKGFSGSVQLMSSQSLSLSESVQIGLEGILSSTTTFGWDGGASVTNGQDITASYTQTLPQGRKGYPSFKQVVQCSNGTWVGCDVTEVTSLPNQEYCLPVLVAFQSQESNPQLQAFGVPTVVDTT